MYGSTVIMRNGELFTKMIKWKHRNSMNLRAFTSTKSFWIRTKKKHDSSEQYGLRGTGRATERSMGRGGKKAAEEWGYNLWLCIFQRRHISNLPNRMHSALAMRKWFGFGCLIDYYIILSILWLNRFLRCVLIFNRLTQRFNHDTRKSINSKPTTKLERR